MNTLAPGETCALLPADAGAHGCRKPRSCQSCLETTGCMVNVVGQCVSPQDTAVDPTIDYRKAIERGLVASNASLAQRPRMRAPQAWQFTAGSVRYCPASDSTCSACVRNNFWRSSSSVQDSRFCLGDDGACVCVDVCERPWYVSQDCGSTAGATASPVHSIISDDIADTLWRGILALVAVTFILLLLFLRKKCSAEELERVRRLQARQARQTVRARALGVNALTLTGWESYRRDLIDKEKARQAEGVSEGEIYSPREASAISTPYVSVGESVASDSSGQSTAISERDAADTPSNVRLAAYNEATPGRHLLMPITTRDNPAAV